MADVDVIFAPPTGYNRYTLFGTIEADDEFPSQPVANDQVILPDALSCDGQLNIAGPVGNYTAWHITAAGVITTIEYSIVNTNAPVASNPTAQVLSSTDIRFQFQTTRTGGSWYLAYSDVGMPDDGDVIDPLNEVAAVAVAGLQSVDVTGLDADTIYYFKAVHAHPDGNSNYVSVQQGTFSTGTVSVDVVYSLPAGYTRATLIDGYYTYALQQWAEVIADDDLTGVQLITASASEYFDNLGNFWFENLDDLLYWAIFPDGVLYTLEITNLDQLSTAIPLNLPDQQVLNTEPDTWVQMPNDVVLDIDVDSSVLSSVDNSLVQQQWSTDGGSTFDGWSTAPRSGLVAGNVGQFRLRSGLDFANVGPDFENLGRVSIQTASFQLRTVNRNAVVPTITQHISNQSVTAGATATLGATATGADSWEWVEQLPVDDVLTEVIVDGAVTNQLAISGATVADDNGRNFAAYAISSEGGRTRSPASGFATLTVIADATRIVIPAGVVTGRGHSAAGTTVQVNVWADDNGRCGQWLYSTNVALAASGVTNLDSNQNGAPGTIRWYSFPSATGGNSEAAFQTTVQAIP